MIKEYLQGLKLIKMAENKVLRPKKRIEIESGNPGIVLN